MSLQVQKLPFVPKIRASNNPPRKFTDEVLDEIKSRIEKHLQRAELKREAYIVRMGNATQIIPTHTFPWICKRF